MFPGLWSRFASQSGLGGVSVCHWSVLVGVATLTLSFSLSLSTGYKAGQRQQPRKLLNDSIGMPIFLSSTITNY